MLTYEELKNKPRELLAATGLKQQEFEMLLKAFAESYKEQYPGQQTVTGQVRQRADRMDRRSQFRHVAERLQDEPVDAPGEESPYLPLVHGARLIQREKFV